MSGKAKSFKELIGGSQPVLVDFYATWCGPCKTMQPILEDASRQLGDKVKIIKVDVDKNPAAANSYQVKGVPTLILFKDGKILWRQSGVVQASQLLQIVNKVAF
ncbi:MAG TPA: thioredoxin [Cyclobacteriaceae bacterium]|nr:thioredoxin [Cyclobacteriaceae bacterium]